MVSLQNRHLSGGAFCRPLHAFVSWPDWLYNLGDRHKPLVHYPPKRPYGLGLVVKKIFKETRLVEGGRVCVPLTVFTEFGKPISRFVRSTRPQLLDQGGETNTVPVPEAVKNPHYPKIAGPLEQHAKKQSNGEDACQHGACRQRTAP